MHSNKKVKKQIIKLLEWIRKYGGYWWLVCTPGDNRMNMDTARKIIKSLAKNGLYEMIFVFFTVHREEEFIKNLLSYLNLELMLEEIKHQDLDRIVRMIDENLQ